MDRVKNVRYEVGKLNIVGVVGGWINSDHWKWTGLKNARYRKVE